MPVDLHIHSRLSDGCCHRSDLIQRALKADLKAISFTDHDVVETDSKPIYNINSLSIVTGVELSVHHLKKDIHVLGYLVNPSNGALREYLQRFREERVRRVYRIVEKLKGLKIEVSPEQILKIAGSGAVGRPHIARAIVEAGYYQTVDDVFEDILMDHGPAWVDKYRLNLQEAVDLIHEAKGLAFSAHPGADDLMEYFGEFLDMGIDGLEVFHPKHSQEVTEAILLFARNHDLLISGGSDFHGLGYGEQHVGEFVIEDVYYQSLVDKWKETYGGNPDEK